MPSHCKGVKKEIRLLHIMPNEIEQQLMHMLQCHANACTPLVGSVEQTANQKAWLSDREPGGMIKRCALEVQCCLLSLTPESERDTSSAAKWETTKTTGKLLF